MNAAQVHACFSIWHNTWQTHIDVNVIKSIQIIFWYFPSCLFMLFCNFFFFFLSLRSGTCISTELNFVGFSHSSKMLISFGIWFYSTIYFLFLIAYTFWKLDNHAFYIFIQVTGKICEQDRATETESFDTL